MKEVLFLLTFLSLIFFSKAACAETQQWVKTSLNVKYASTLEPTPWGILVGEKDGNLSANPPPLDGIYLSKDLGNTWDFLGLRGRGVIDIKYFEGKIYATTYYVKDGTLGLFVSNDKGKTWNKIGPSYPPTKVNRDEKTIYLGEEYYGLWISHDEGQTWVQKIGNGGDGIKIKAIESSNDVTFVSTTNKVYKTIDNGDTWQEVPFLSPKGIIYFTINDNVVFAGSSGGLGLFLSTDKGNTWRWLSSFGTYPVNNITYLDGKYYVGRLNPLKQKYTVYVTTDLGSTWIDTEPDSYLPDNVVSLGGVYNDSPYLFSAVPRNGVYKYKVQETVPLKYPFLDIPWSYSKTNELLDNVTSFFDHSFPLLGYGYFQEPEVEKNTTLNFLGIKDVEPIIYYSSHSGIDFGLKYGTEILAPSSGYATYYYCDGCGNTIKIDHQNGFQTTYMHLQSDGLVTKNANIWVNKGDIIGKVGMTGRTTGPHLHFEVLFDKNNNGNFSDDFPSGRVDPFGWEDLKNNDPWKYFLWTDSLGNHEGSESKYLWSYDKSKLAKLIYSNSSSQDLSIGIDNKLVNFQTQEDFFTSRIFPHIQPVLDLYTTYSTNQLKYIKNTSLVLEAINQLGSKITSFDNDIQMSINLDLQDLENVNLNTISIYFWNEVLRNWEKIPSIFNNQESKVTANVNHLSWFAVFGEKIDAAPPNTEIIVSGTQIDGWYIYFPLLELSCNDNENNQIENTFYSIDGGNTWERYLVPFYLENDGITELIYKSQDVNENMESEKSYVIQINTQGKRANKNKVVNAFFSTQN